MSYGAINYHQIKAARGLLGITRSELAEAIHTHEQYLDAVERDYELDEEIRANVTAAAVEELERRGVEFVSTAAGSYGVAYRMPGDNEILDALDGMLGN